MNLAPPAPFVPSSDVEMGADEDADENMSADEQLMVEVDKEHQIDDGLADGEYDVDVYDGEVEGEMDDEDEVGEWRGEKSIAAPDDGAGDDDDDEYYST